MFRFPDLVLTSCQVQRGSKFFVFEFDATLFGFDVNDKAPKELFDKHKSGETNKYYL